MSISSEKEDFFVSKCPSRKTGINYAVFYGAGHLVNAFIEVKCKVRVYLYSHLERVRTLTLLDPSNKLPQIMVKTRKFFICCGPRWKSSGFRAQTPNVR